MEEPTVTIEKSKIIHFQDLRGKHGLVEILHIIYVLFTVKIIFYGPQRFDEIPLPEGCSTTICPDKGKSVTEREGGRGREKFGGKTCRKHCPLLIGYVDTCSARPTPNHRAGAGLAACGLAAAAGVRRARKQRRSMAGASLVGNLGEWLGRY